MKFTPGPWKVSGSKDFVKTADDKAICRMAQNKSVWEWAAAAGSLATSANAALIASAPDLYEACKAMWIAQARLNGNLPTWFNEAMELGRKALAKAEGKE